MEELNTKIIFKTIADEMQKLPHDKSLHFAGSYYLCMDSKPFSNEPIESSICILKAVFDSFRVGLEKEYQDSGKSFKEVDKLFDGLIENLKAVYDDYVKNKLYTEKHETDLLADLIGIGAFVVNQSMRNLNWINSEEE